MECKSRNQEILGVTGKFGLGVQSEAGQRLIEFCQENALVIANKESEMQYLDAISKTTDLSVFFSQGKPFNITVIQVYAPTSNAEEAEVKWFKEDQQDLLETTPKIDVLFIVGD